MKINNECARKILLEVEKIEYGETITVDKLHSKISDYKIEEVLFIVNMFNKENILKLLDKASYDDNDVLRDHKIKGLTEKGYKALDSVRDDKVWNMLKNQIEDFNNISIFSIFDIAYKIMNYNYNKLFGLPEDMFMPNNRW